MSTPPKQIFHRSARALTGVVVLAAAAVTVVTVSTLPLPSVQRAASVETVDVRSQAKHEVVCPGSFAVLGADQNRATVAVPTGTVSRTISGDPEEIIPLSTEEPALSEPVSLITSNDNSVGAAQTQQVDEFGVRGLVASACVVPANEQWLVGGSTVIGNTTTLVLNNPSTVPATVGISLFDADGQIDTARTSGVLVAAQSQRIVSLNGYAPGREQLAVRVESSGAAVTATLGISAVSDLKPFAADSVTRQLTPQKTLYIPGVVNISDQEFGPGDAGELDRHSLRVRVLAPEGEAGVAEVFAVFADGTRQSLATLNYESSAVSEQLIELWPEKASGIVIEAPDPLVAGVLGSKDIDGSHDNSWFSPSPELVADREVRIPVVEGGRLVLMNPQPDALVATLIESDNTKRDITVPGGSAVPVAGNESVVLLSDKAVHAAVYVEVPGGLASYPVVGLIERNEPLEIYTR